ncbi:hypothetical protein F5Y11DRAFT_311465 [Daldinia sp. FL1419]|nr:hypothetical protein F5Y11DRAFT_311465 [Daldinia sp. FL1419]
MAPPQYKPLMTWTWNGKPLTLPMGDVDPADSLELTAFAVDQIRKCKFNTVRGIIEEVTDLKRLIELKEVRVKGEKTLAEFDLMARQQRHSAIAAYLTLEPTNTSPCTQCQSARSTGPCKYCIAGPPNLFNGGCTNCQYSSTSSKCSFNLNSEKTNKKKRGRSDSMDSDSNAGKFVLDEEMLQELTTRELEGYKNLIENELDKRSLSYTLNKRRHR